MDDGPCAHISERMLFRCHSCGATRASRPGDLHRHLADDATWPRCCGMRMAISFPFPRGHVGLIVRPES